MKSALLLLLAWTLFAPAHAAEEDAGRALFDGQGRQEGSALESLGLSGWWKGIKDAVAPASPAQGRFWVELAAKDKYERTRIASAGVAIEGVASGHVRGIADAEALRLLKEQGVEPVAVAPLALIRTEGFPPGDAAFHTYEQTVSALRQVAQARPDFASMFSIGKSLQGRDLWALKLGSGSGTKPAVVFMGTHHAREHLSTEVPLMLAQYLAGHASDPKIKKLLAAREIYILPLVNPDGAEHDVETGEYQWQRKNMRDNGDGTVGVDLNRNYGYGWGGEGASERTESETYRGPGPFSEPETQAVRDFITAHSNITVLLTYHSFSELILYPWGHSYDPLPNADDAKAFDKMARTMAQWNGYTPEPASSLYLASGDTCDWAYGERGIFAFTFELDPKNDGSGGFYPGARAIVPTFDKNLPAALDLIDLADNPRRVLSTN